MTRLECTLYTPEPEPIHEYPASGFIIAFAFVVYALTGCFLGWVTAHWR